MVPLGKIVGRETGLTMEISAGLTGDFVGRVTGLTMVISAGSCDTATLAKAIAMTRER